MYEVTHLTSGQTEHLTLEECNDYFGEDEFKEIVEGYDSTVVAIWIEGLQP